MFKRIIFVPLLAIWAGGCSDPEAENIARQQQLNVQSQKLSSILADKGARISTGDEGLTIQLTFGADADLDLYVTDPLLETVYFANDSGKSGGRISEDIRCDDDGSDKGDTNGDADSQGEAIGEIPRDEFGADEIRIEEVRFDNPIPGKYRIGIDYPRKCEGGQEQAAFAVSVLHHGEQTETLGSVSFERFEVVVMEFEI